MDEKETIPPEIEALIRRIFSDAPFMKDLGAEVVSVAPGVVQSRLDVETRHRQHNGYLHAGVAATMADHTAGAAAATLTPPDKIVLTVEFKLNLLRPGVGDVLTCRAQVLKPGRMLCVVESEVFMADERERLVAKATVTLAYVDRSETAQRA